MFYMALHWVDRTLAASGQHPTAHRQRAGAAAQRWPAERDARRAFHALWRLAEQVRYDAYVPSDDDLRAADTALALLFERYT